MEGAIDGNLPTHHKMLLKSQYSSFKYNSKSADTKSKQYMFQNTSLQASLPSLSDQIHINLTAVRVEMKSYDEGPPLEPERIGPYFSKVSTQTAGHLVTSNSSQSKINFCFSICLENVGV